MRVKNLNKTKVMISGERQKQVQKAVRWPCVFVVEVLVVIQYSVLAVRSGYTRSVVVQRVACVSKVRKSFICRGWLNPVTSAGSTSVDIGASANLELVDKFCYLGDMLSVDQLWRQEFELDEINSGSWYLCLPIRIYH